MRLCHVCGLGHPTLMRCDVARRIEATRLANEVVVHAPELVVHAAEANADGSSRHGVYADPEARKVYRREWAKRDRAKKKAKPEFRDCVMALDFHDGAK